MWNARRTRYALGIAIVAAMVMPEREVSLKAAPIPMPHPIRIAWKKIGRSCARGASGGRQSASTSIATARAFGFDRCATADDCSGSNLAPIQKFDASGNLVTSFGAGMFNYPHGLFVDRDDNVWVCAMGGQRTARARQS